MKKLFCILFSIMLILPLASCIGNSYKDVDDTPDESLPAPETREELYSFYGKVERDMTMAQITELFGEGKPVRDDFGDVKYYNYLNEKKSAGVSVIYDDENVVDTKLLWFNSKKNLVPFSGRYDNEKVSTIKSDMSVETAVEAMGSAPLELSCKYGDTGPLDISKIYCWYNEDASSFMLHTSNGTIENVALYRD